MSCYVTSSGTSGVFLDFWTVNGIICEKKYTTSIAPERRLQISVLLISYNRRLERKPDPRKMFVSERLTRGLLLTSREVPSVWLESK